MSQIKAVCTFSELRKLEVINLCDGSRMGCVSDIEFDLCLGNVTAIMVPKRTDFFELFKRGRCHDHRIPWCQIERIGDETILVRFEETCGCQ